LERKQAGRKRKNENQAFGKQDYTPGGVNLTGHRSWEHGGLAKKKEKMHAVHDGYLSIKARPTEGIGDKQG